MEHELVVRARAGDVEAFSVLVSQAIDRLHAIAFRILRDADAADDATQQALIDAWEHLGSLRDPERFEAWMYRLVVNAAYRVVRKERSMHGRVRRIAVGGTVERDPIEEVTEREELDRAFRELSVEHRAVIVLHYYADLPLSQIAEVLDIPVGTVGSRIHHAVGKLRAMLERDAEGLVARGHPA